MEERGGAGVGLEPLEEKGWSQEAARWAPELDLLLSPTPRLARVNCKP